MAGNLIAKSLHGHTAGQPQGNCCNAKSSLEDIPLGEELATISPTGVALGWRAAFSRGSSCIYRQESENNRNSKTTLSGQGRLRHLDVHPMHYRVFPARKHLGRIGVLKPIHEKSERAA
jgi:hypothetical protein